MDCDTPLIPLSTVVKVPFVIFPTFTNVLFVLGLPDPPKTIRHVLPMVCGTNYGLSVINNTNIRNQVGLATETKTKYYLKRV